MPRHQTVFRLVPCTDKILDDYRSLSTQSSQNLHGLTQDWYFVIEN
jgi:hypothetical protein